MVVHEKVTTNNTQVNNGFIVMRLIMCCHEENMYWGKENQLGRDVQYVM